MQAVVAVVSLLVVVATYARIAASRRRRTVRPTFTTMISPAGHEVMSPRTNPADRFGVIDADPVILESEPARLS